jgi:hypothetical protein
MREVVGLDPRKQLYISVLFCRKFVRPNTWPWGHVVAWPGCEIYFLFSHTVFGIDFMLKRSTSEGPFILAVDLIKHLVKTIFLLMVI